MLVRSSLTTVDLQNAAEPVAERQPHYAGFYQQLSHIGSGFASSSFKRLRVFRPRAFPDRPFLIFPGLGLGPAIIPRLLPTTAVSMLFLPSRSPAVPTLSHGAREAKEALLTTRFLTPEHSIAECEHCASPPATCIIGDPNIKILDRGGGVQMGALLTLEAVQGVAGLPVGAALSVCQ